ncbi:MAG: hypothetical protein Ta2E_12770 [Mycoplasmoidaceae bacterium]|nr:MAG: hypothetical protein Ta2E_12770 [Mycoplasmoidaceae bacterium]
MQEKKVNFEPEQLVKNLNIGEENTEWKDWLIELSKTEQEQYSLRRDRVKTFEMFEKNWKHDERNHILKKTAIRKSSKNQRHASEILKEISIQLKKSRKEGINPEKAVETGWEEHQRIKRRIEEIAIRKLTDWRSWRHSGKTK